MVILSVSISEWSCMQTVKEKFKKWNNLHVGEASHRINDHSWKKFHACNNNEMLMKNEIVLVQSSMYQNDIKRSLKSSKQHSYKAKHKSARNETQDMESGLTQKQLRWMCWRLLDVMWDVRAAKLMWGMSFVVYGSWVLIKSKMWHACHKSRKSNTLCEVFEMILACNLQLLKVDPWIKGYLCMLPWEKEPMHENQFCSVPEGTGQLNYTCKRLLNCWEKMCISGKELSWLPRRFAQFLGRAVDCYLGLRNS